MQTVLCSVVTLLFVFIYSGTSQIQSGPLPQLYQSPASCTATQFYQSANLSCITCGANQLAADDGLSCVCDVGHIKVSPSTNLQCRPCGINQVSSRDGLFCLSCENGLDVASGTCNECPLNTQITVDTLPASSAVIGNRSCVECPQGTWSSPSLTHCVECGLTDCQQCVVTGGVCFSSALPPPPTQPFNYYTQQFTAARELCRTNRNRTACQLLGNLCVLQSYLPTDPACDESALLAASNTLPPLYYPSRQAGEILRRNDIISRLSTRPNGANVLPLALAAFTLNGTFKGLYDITDDIIDDIILCRDRPSRSAAALRVGVHYVIECSLSVAELRGSSTAPLFYDLYYRDVIADGSELLYPIPVLLTNYRDASGELVNSGGDVDRWQLVRRFYLVQSLTDTPLYARSMRLIVRLSSSGQVFPPYLRISYESWNPSSVDEQSFPCSYITQYSQPGYSFTIGLCVSLSLLILLVVVFSGFRLNGFLRRSGRQCCDPHAVVYVTMEFFGGLSTAIFILLTVAGVFWLLFFKVQSSFLFVLPVERQELAFQIMLGVGLFCRALHVGYMIWEQCSVDLFFIDWEKSRGLLLPSNQPRDGPLTTPTSSSAPVSIWRTLFAVNEWNEIQSIRKINPTLLLCLVLLFGEVVGLEVLSETDPQSHVTHSQSRYSAPHSSILRFSITSLHFIIIAVILRLFVFLVYERFFEHKIQQFVDLCSVSNISVFILSHTLYGHYIHGRSAHGHADTDMREMNSNLSNEEENRSGRRGLELESDIQCYEMTIKTQVRNHYDRIVAVMAANRGQSTKQARNARLNAYEEMNGFLSTFIERSVQGLNYLVKDKLFVEKILRMEFFDNETMSTFYRDHGYNFDGVLFYGNEWCLFLLDVFVFAVVDLFSESYVLAAVITFTVYWLLAVIRNAWGRRNIGRKTLVDERFLI